MNNKVSQERITDALDQLGDIYKMRKAMQSGKNVMPVFNDESSQEHVDFMDSSIASV